MDTLIEWRTLIITNYVTSEKKAKILKELLPLKINKEIREQLEIIEDEDDLVLLSKFNILIKENLREEPSAFIYEKIGTRYQHYFLMNSKTLPNYNGKILSHLETTPSAPKTTALPS